MGLFKKKKLETSLIKTRTTLLGKIGELVGLNRNIDRDFLDALEEVLITSDLGVKATIEIIEDLQDKVKQSRLRSSEDIYDALKNELKRILIYRDNSPAETRCSPYVVTFVGVNGTGKTTSIAKFAYRLKQSGKRILLVAADTFRAAAQEQLSQWAQRYDITVVNSQAGSDSAAVAFDALEKALAQKYEYVLVDTAGRLHTKSNLMEELKKLNRVMAKKIPGAPHETLLVLDATTGQNGIQQALAFNQALNLTGIFLTKLDGTAKGGIVLAIKKELDIPVKYVGTGEKIEDMVEFDPEEFVEDIFRVKS
ncbi:signal recognition particle-docking protein FtsY [bacterium]|nr:signal recognition particle-docking protein FtsY [bacterium]